ncbi:MAG: N-acetylmuramoyl-L-alanine amidase [Deltaproteobacteria bacterium]|nr:N-acetylmuramoyl-L-alanine amidase [Deltaproteobacteria bacterium]
MKVNHSIKSPNYDDTVIPVEFVVLHYSACGLQATFELFRDPAKKVSSHLVISSSGEVYEVVKSLEGKALRAWHAGKSSWNDGVREWSDFNNFSIGIEIINNNGNLIPYHDKQYEALTKVMHLLKKQYPSLQDPKRVIGHEQIAGFRGKVDPGWLFEWSRFYSSVYPQHPVPERAPALPASLKEKFEKFLSFVPADEKTRAEYWKAISSAMEASVSEIRTNRGSPATLPSVPEEPDPAA